MSTLETKTQIRLVCYPRVVGDTVKNFYGFFTVEMVGGKPARAKVLQVDNFFEVAVALDTASEMWDTLFNDNTLLCLHTIDPAAGPWDGTLTF